MASDTDLLSYTGRDIASIRKELIDEIPKLTSKWTDFNESDVGMILLELIASVTDMLNFYLDNQAFETYLDTAKQEKNIRSLLRAMNYRVPLMNNAKGTLIVNFANDDLKSIEIPKYTVVSSSRTDLNVHYCTADTVSNIGKFDTLYIPIMEGTVHKITLSKNDLNEYLNDNGNISRRIYLGYTNVADKSIEIVQSTGTVWSECDDALLKYNGGYYYSVHTDSEGQVYVFMSVNYLTLIENDDTITITFVTTQGTDGVVESNTLDKIDYNLDDVVRIYNPIKTYGASDKPTDTDLETMKILARNNAISMGRCITLEDFKNVVDSYPYVYQSIVKDWKYPEYVDEPYLVKIWAVDRLGEGLRELDINEISMDIYSKCNVDTSIKFETVNNVKFNIHAKLVITSTTYSEKTKIRDAVKQKLLEYYSPQKMSFNESISYALLDSRIRAVSPYIADIQILEPSADVKVGLVEFPKLENITLDIVDKLE